MESSGNTLFNALYEACDADKIDNTADKWVYKPQCRESSNGESIIVSGKKRDFLRAARNKFYYVKLNVSI